MSATIIPFLDGAAFEPDHLEAMGRAFDQARRALHDKGQPNIVQDIIAKKIIAIAKTGERNADRMCERALATLGIQIAS
jgi:hypothetical protein